MAEKPDQFIATRESLLSRLKDPEDQATWREFFDIYRRLICGLAIRAGLKVEEAEEVLQDTLISVANTIQEFKYDPKRCRFKSWLGHLAQKRIADRFRKRAAANRHLILNQDEGSKTREIEQVPDPAGLNLDAAWDQEWQQELFEAALANVRARVNAEQYQIFDFYVLRKMAVRNVARALGVSIGQVYLAKHRILGLIKTEVKQLEKKMG